MEANQLTELKPRRSPRIIEKTQLQTMEANQVVHLQKATNINEIQRNPMETNCTSQIQPRRSPRIFERNQHHAGTSNQAPSLILRQSPRILERNQHQARNQSPSLILRRSPRILERNQRQVGTSNQSPSLILRRSPRILERNQRQVGTSNQSPSLILRRSPRILERNQRQVGTSNQSPSLILRRSPRNIEKAKKQTLLDAQLKAERKRQRRSEFNPEQRAQELERRNIRDRMKRNSMTETEREAKRKQDRSNYHIRKSRRCEENINDHEPQTSTDSSFSFSCTQNIQGQYFDDSMNNEDEQYINRNTTQRVTQPCRSATARHNCARSFIDHSGFQRFYLPQSKICRHCQAKLFHRESNSFCCLNGKIILQSISSPDEIFDLYNDQSNEGKHFRKNIRAYNHMFAFTSMGVHVDENLATGKDGVYTFRAQGSIYHKIGSLVPTVGDRPRFLQLYIYDTEHEIDNRLTENNTLKRDIVEKLQNTLSTHNRFAVVFRQLGQKPNIQHCKLIIKEQSSNQKQYTLPTSSQVAGIWVEGAENEEIHERDIVVETNHGQLITVPETAGYYDPLQYPLLLPYGSYGWDINSQDENGKKISCREYYANILQIRENDKSLFLRGGRLFQQYAVDNYVKIDSSRLRWYRSNQKTIRAEMYQGLQDALEAGENDASNVGTRTILPSSYIGCPRDMYQRYHDAMALVHKYGKPDLFITMTCNPLWDEIVNELLPGQDPQDRPDLTTRIFRAKYEELKKDIFTEGALGKVAAHVHVIEFQKRGLPHVHMLIIFEDEDKLTNPDEYDEIVRAEIPDSNEEPELHAAVIKWMIHGPCGTQNRNCPCMKNGSCKREYPKQFSNVTVQGTDSYPIYRRRNTGIFFPIDGNDNLVIDNRWVVPYNPWLLRKYNCHINVEICSSIKSVKYLYKYVYKGPDRVSMQVRPGPKYDEIQQFVDARWISAPEALWKIFRFSLSKIYPSVERLQIHLPNKQSVMFSNDQTINEVLADESNLQTMLTEFFYTNSIDGHARQLLYREFPEHYRWIKNIKKWKRRESNIRVIGRIYTVLPTEGERFFLRILLNHIRGPSSFDDLLTVDEVRSQTFKEAAEKRGLLENDDSIKACLTEASSTKMPNSLRALFVTILVFCNPIGVRGLWDEFFDYMVEDYRNSSTANQILLTNRLLKDLNMLLLQHNKSTTDYDLPSVSRAYDCDAYDDTSELIEEELAIPISENDLLTIENLNDDQLRAYNTIMNAIVKKEKGLFFIDGPGGTGKTYLYRAILSTIRKDGGIAIATATSGIAATILPGGRTAHSRFKLPLQPKATSTCSISKQSKLAKLLKQSTVLMWDEATMVHRYAFEAFDRTMRDIMDINEPFGGKILIMGGDFRQVLPVVPKATRSEAINACIIKSLLWEKFKILHLKKNMRAADDVAYSKFLIRIGNGTEPSIDDEMIQVPTNMVITSKSDVNPLTELINTIFPNLSKNAFDKEYIVNRALITPLNEYVDKLNEHVLNIFPGNEVIYYSYDAVEDDARNLYQQEFLNSIAPGGLPPHCLKLKLGAPIMLLRNLNPKVGLCNGTRLICKQLNKNCIDAEIITGHYAGTRVFIPRIPLKPPENLNLPFVFIRKQFPIRLCFAFTINKAQGQTIKHTGIFLPEHVFGHGQLYVALSRGVSSANTKVLVENGHVARHTGTFTKNVVYQDVLLTK